MRFDARLAIAAATVLLTACAATSAPAPAPSPTAASPTAAPSPAAPSPSPQPSPPAQPSPEPEPDPLLSDDDLAAMGVNELARIPIVMWHDVSDRDSRWDNSLETFRGQIRELYERGYRPVTAAEFAAGTFPIPPGTSPVLLTFDDSYRSHLFFDEAGEPHPDSVVGVLEALAAEDPDWRATAIFSFYWPVPFREASLVDDKLRWLVEHGYELANHGYNHENLREVGPDGARESLARSERRLQDAIPGHRLRVLTLPFGAWPDPPDLAFAGEWDGHRYEHDLVLNVGFMPTRSPHHVEFDPSDVQRVQSYTPEFDKWIEWLDAGPHRRYVSDGDPSTVAYPASFEDVAAPRDGFEVRVYDDGSVSE